MEEWGAMLLRVLVVASLLSAATAHAQAPGEMAPQPIGPGGYAPVGPCACAPHESVMANRWAVGLSVGSLGLAPKDQPDAQTQFGIGELSLRYRATLHLEVELALGGGREQLADGSQGDHQVNAAALGLRYRFRPEQAWNWWLMGALGGVSVTAVGATDQERKDAQRPMTELGVGIERRFRRFALHAELRAIGVAEDPNGAAPVKVAPSAPNMMVPPPGPAPSTAQSGGQLTIGASYYF